MTRRQRLQSTFRGLPVDRPAVSFYEIGGWRMDRDDSEYTVWNDPSWRPLVELALRETDIMRLVQPRWRRGSDHGLAERTSTRVTQVAGSRFTRTVVRAARGVELTTVVRRDPDVQTDWVVEHPLKCAADVEAYLGLPEPSAGEADVAPLLEEERELGEAGIVCLDTGDPICSAAALFSMETYTVFALEEPALFHRLLSRFLRILLPRIERYARAAPGRLWRIYGPEYAGEPYLPPRLYPEYVTRYTGRLVRAIQATGGWARIHAHGRLKAVLPHIMAMEPDAMDPLEPPPQGDMELGELRREIGERVVLLGNIEAADIENLEVRVFERAVVRALREGTEGTGRGFILHPSACPYGRTITARTLANYRTMVRMARDWNV